MRHFILYFAIGLTCVLIEVYLYKLLILQINFYIANIIAIFLASIFSFLMNLNFNFKRDDQKLTRYIKFISVIIFGMVLSTLLLKIMFIYYDPIIAKYITIPIVAFSQFLFNKYWTFRKIKN